MRFNMCALHKLCPGAPDQAGTAWSHVLLHVYGCRSLMSLMMQRCDSWCLCQIIGKHRISNQVWFIQYFQSQMNLSVRVLASRRQSATERRVGRMQSFDVYPAMERRNMLHNMFLMLRGFTTCLVNFQNYVLVNFKVMFGQFSKLCLGWTHIWNVMSKSNGCCNGVPWHGASWNIRSKTLDFRSSTIDFVAL